jgi:hypothetical protein
MYDYYTVQHTHVRVFLEGPTSEQLLAVRTDLELHVHIQGCTCRLCSVGEAVHWQWSRLLVANLSTYEIVLGEGSRFA